MIRETKNYKVVIFGEPYTLRSDEPEQQIQQVAALVDCLMQKIAGGANKADAKNVAVLAALQMASTVVALEAEIKEQAAKEEQLIEQINQALDTTVARAQESHTR